TTRLAIGSLLTLPLLACGQVASAPGISPDDAPAQLAQAICPKAYDCCMANQLMSNTQAGTDEPTCETNTQAAFANQVAGIEASEKSGRSSYDGTKVQACVTYLRAAACADLAMTNHFSGIPACASFIEPKVAVGGACGNDYECIEGWCDKTGVPDGGDGACHALGQSGDSCANGAQCAATLSCDATAMTCGAAPTSTTAATSCFYSSACSYAGGDRGAASLLGLGLLAAALATRTRSHRRSRP
ncbi:MAG TPA: hypothetical protein VK989_19755, partial [Polyangia bacterium]|nr:hypothetical protein [Polyangia bacterium]